MEVGKIEKKFLNKKIAEWIQFKNCLVSLTVRFFSEVFKGQVKVINKTLKFWSPNKTKDVHYTVRVFFNEHLHNLSVISTSTSDGNIFNVAMIPLGFTVTTNVGRCSRKSTDWFFLYHKVSSC